MNRIRSLVAIAGTVAALGSFAKGDQLFRTWQGPPSGAWNAAGNWDPFGVPNNNASNTFAAIIPGGGSPVITGSITIDKFGIAPGGSISIGNNSNLVVRAQTDGLGVIGLLSNEGIFAMNSTGNITDLLISGPAGSSAVHGNRFGTPAHFQTSNTQANRIYGQNGVEKLIFGAETILEGSLQLGVNGLEIENFGQVRAVGSSGVTIDPNAAGLTNHGVLEAATGTLSLVNGTFRNVGSGAIVANAGQTVVLQSARIEGGQFDTSISGHISPRSSILADTRLNGFIRIPNNNNSFIETGLQLVNSGSFLVLDSTGNTTDLVITTDVTVHGVSFNAGITATNTQANRMYSNAGTRLTLADTSFIRGSMQLGVNSMSLTVNEACAVEASGSSGMTLDPNPDGVLNHGVLRSLGGSFLTLSAGAFDNTDGDIVAEPDGTVNIASSVILGGNLAGGGVFFLTTSELNAVSNNADVRIPNNNNSNIRDSLVNNTSLTLASTGNTTDLIIRGNTTFSGSGTILASNTQANRIYAEGGVGRLTNSAGHTIRGSMQLCANGMSMTNNGLIEAAGSSGMTIDPNGAGAENNNIIRANSGSSLTLTSGAFDNSGGTIVVQDNASCSIAASLIDQGLLNREGNGFFALTSSELNAVTNNAELRIPNNNNSSIRTSLINNGSLNLNSTGNTTDLIIRGDTTFSGPGNVFGTNTQANRIYAEGGVGRLTNSAGHTIRGSVQLCVNGMSVTNNGLIEAVGSSGMTIDPNGAGVDNNSMIRATSGSSLTLASGGFDNADGVILAQDASSIAITSSVITGGSLTAAGTGSFSMAASELSGVTSTAPVGIPNNNNSFIRTSMVNNGTLRLSSTGNTTDLIIRGDTTISGNGSIVGSNTQANRLYSEGGTGRLINGAGHTIRGSMQLGINGMAMTNQGRIESDSSSGMNIDLNGIGLDNQGEIAVTGGTLTMQAGPFTTSGVVAVNAGQLFNRVSGDFIQTGGQVTANGEIQVVGNDYQLQGGFLGGVGLVDSLVTNSGGVVSPGNSAGRLTIEGGYVQQALGVLAIELGGFQAGVDHDQLAVTAGSTTLGGILAVSRLDGFNPGVGAMFTIMTSTGPITGTFASISPANYTVQYNANSVVLIVSSPPICAADFNGDGLVFPDDLSEFITCFFLQVQFPGFCPRADFNGDGFAFPDDLSEFITTFFLNVQFGC